MQACVDLIAGGVELPYEVWRKNGAPPPDHVMLTTSAGELTSPVRAYLSPSPNEPGHIIVLEHGAGVAYLNRVPDDVAAAVKQAGPSGLVLLEVPEGDAAPIAHLVRERQA